MQVNSYVGLITNSSTSIYSYADEAAFSRFFEALGKDFTIVTYPSLDSMFDVLYERAEEQPEIMDIYFMEYIGTLRWGLKKTEVHEEKYPECWRTDTGGSFTNLRSVKDYDMTPEELAEKYPEYYGINTRLKTVEEILEASSFEDFKAHMQFLHDNVEESYDYPRPDVYALVFDENMELTNFGSMALSLFDHDAVYNG